MIYICLYFEVLKRGGEGRGQVDKSLTSVLCWAFIQICKFEFQILTTASVTKIKVLKLVATFKTLIALYFFGLHLILVHYNTLSCLVLSLAPMV